MRRHSIELLAVMWFVASGCGMSTGLSVAPGSAPASGREGASSGGMSRAASGSEPIVNAWAPQTTTDNVIAGPLFGGGSGRAPTPIRFGTSVRGHLEANDAPAGEGLNGVVDDYVFAGAAGQAITIDVVGGELDREPGTHLDVLVTLLRGGEVIGRDDDGGGNLNSRLSLALPGAGEYVIRVGTFGGQLREGAYTVSVHSAIPAPGL